MSSGGHWRRGSQQQLKCNQQPPGSPLEDVTHLVAVGFRDVNVALARKDEDISEHNVLEQRALAVSLPNDPQLPRGAGAGLRRQRGAPRAVGRAVGVDAEAAEADAQALDGAGRTARPGAPQRLANTAVTAAGGGRSAVHPGQHAHATEGSAVGKLGPWGSSP